ncbi:MAG: hypothetical protein H6Q90_680 [Deltaproteobacteria bacterium]|nr:hypothetical protein [Deltaproteobacteria bacterium]
MTIDFRFEHVFRAPSTTTVLAGYFDPDHLATQDQVAELGDRTVLTSHDEGQLRSCTWRVTSQRPLPLFVRPFVSGGRLSYLESMTWRRTEDAIDLTIQPEILGGRVQITARYRLSQVGANQILRCYEGSIAVNLKLVSGRIERAILSEFEKSMPLMTSCTQGWLDRSIPAGS